MAQMHINIYAAGVDDDEFGFKGRSEQSFYYLGFGLHTAMDSSSPVHKDFEEWSYWNLLDHGHWWWDSSKEDHATPSQIKKAVEDMSKAAKGTFKFNCDCY